MRRLWAPNPRAGTVYPLGTGASELPTPRAGLLSFVRKGPNLFNANVARRREPLERGRPDLEGTVKTARRHPDWEPD